MTSRAVHWHEGMFLRPHHLQAAQRHTERLLTTGAKWDHHYNWGLRSIDLDRTALGNHRLVIRSLRARLRDGTLVAMPEETLLPALDLKAALAESGGVTVYLAVPALNLNRANAAGAGNPEGCRWLLDMQELEDENTGLNPQPLQVRRLNLTPRLSGQDHAGYEVLPLVRVQKSARSDAVPEVDEFYIPPLLACDAWPVLQAGILQYVFDRLGKKIDLRAGQVVGQGIGLESQAQGDALIVARLRVYNEAYALLGQLAFLEGIHPLTAYVELCRLIGQLSIFSDERRPPELPRYDHDDLGGCFFRLKQYLDDLLEKDADPEYKEAPFIGAGLRMQVALQPSWLEQGWQMFVGVQSQLEPRRCIELLTNEGQLQMKIGSADRADEIYRRGEAGLRFAAEPTPPRSLPGRQGLIYFRVLRESQEEEWKNVQKSLSMAIRLNEHRITGDIQGKQVLTVKPGGGQTTTLQFTLYVVPQGK